jgi:hypothetical protein
MKLIVADLRYELPSKSEVGAIHELPLPQISEIASKKIILEFSNDTNQSRIILTLGQNHEL